MLSEYEKNSYIIIDNLLEQSLYNQLLELCTSSEYEEVNQVREGRYKLWETKEDENFPSNEEDYLAHIWASESVLKTDLFKEVFENYIKPHMLFITDNKVSKFMHQANKYHNDTKDFIRLHYDDYMGVCGYIFYVNEVQWKYDWGGLLQFIKDDKISTVLPNPNRLVITDHSARIGHWVTPTNVWAKANRYALTGFSLEEDRELPETWKKRIDE